MKKKVTAQCIRNMKGRERITMLTSYDATFARLVDKAGIDAILVGDSLGMVVQGHSSTIPVTVDHIAYHCAAVTRAVKRAHVVADMPFGSYQASDEDAVRSAIRLMKEGGAEAVKMEGGSRVVEPIRRLSAAGVPVMGHLGLTPQSVHAFGGHKVQGRAEDEAECIFQDALQLQDAGCYCIVLEGIPAALAQRISKAITIPTIGIGAGPDCDGQVLVIYDLLGMDERFNPKFLKKYEDFSSRIKSAVETYRDDVREARFPGPEHSFE